jgi:tRNA threonylcarbamoyladenosine modification (KEOPS) complex  Pcc1 subunit
MTVREQQKSLVELEKPANSCCNHTINAGNVSPLQASAYSFRVSSSLELTQSTSTLDVLAEI